jgi:hypothetical protein
MDIFINSSLEMRIVTCSVLLIMVVHADFTVSNMNFAVMFVVTLNLELLMVLFVQVVVSFLQEVQLMI